MQNQVKFKDLEIISLIEQTHQQSTKVYLAKLKDKIVVCKSILKSSIIDDKKLQHLTSQKQALKHFSDPPNPHINHLLLTFKDAQNLHFLLEPVQGLPLHRLFKMVGKFDPQFVALVVVQIAWILEQFHKEGYIYRDIKASNFIVNKLGVVTMIDLGLAKRVNKERTLTICGTLHAIPPEVLFGGGNCWYAYEFDYYQLGVLMYEMIVGRPPFGYENVNPNIRQDISKGLSQSQKNQVKDPVAYDLISKLMDKPSERLGVNGGWREIFTHQYFGKLDLKEIRQIYEGRGQELLKKWGFKNIIQEIEDFGLEESRYEVNSEDPFNDF